MAYWRRLIPVVGEALRVRRGPSDPPWGRLDEYVDENWYREIYPNVQYSTEKGEHLSPLDHYLSVGVEYCYSPNPFFDEHFYREVNTDVNESIDNGSLPSGFAHFLSSGAREKRQPSPIVDLEWYADQYSEAREAVEKDVMANLFEYFYKVGLRAGHSLTPDFDDRSYLDLYPEAAEAVASGKYFSGYHHYMSVGLLSGFDVALPSASDTRGVSHRTYRELARSSLNQFLQSPRQLTFPASSSPLVSVIIVVHNSAELLYRCLCALRLTTQVNFELVILDNRSTDDTPRLLDAVDGATVVLQDRNLHFVRGVNLAASYAKGEYMLLLNSDCEVQPGSLDTSCALLESQPDLGAVGARLIAVDGSLQEAGCGLTSTAQPYAFGRHDDPFSGAYMVERDVVYCSAAFLLTRSKLFQEIGGFDKRYVPAYFEDVDYCLRLRERGWRTVLNPRATCIHFERGSSARAMGTELIFFRNQTRLKRRHTETLCRLDLHPEWPPEYVEEGSEPMRILFCDDFIPLPSRGSGLPRACQIVKALNGNGYRVTVFPTILWHEEWESIYEAIPRPVECMRGHTLADLEGFLETRRGYYSRIWVSRPHNMRAILDLQNRNPKLFEGLGFIYDAEALFSDRTTSRAELTDATATDSHIPAWEFEEEVGLAKEGAVVSVVSEADRSRLVDAGVNAHLLGHSVPYASPTARAFTERRDLLFVGAVYERASPNYDGLSWFVNEVFPKLRELQPGLRLYVVGWWEVPVGDLTKQAGIHFVGRVEDIGSYYDQSRVFVAPLRYGAGLPLKIVEAAAYGLPVMTTELGYQQLGWRPHADLMAGPWHDSTLFAKKLLNLYEDESLWTRIRREALLRVHNEYSTDIFKQQVLSIVSNCELSRS